LLLILDHAVLIRAASFQVRVVGQFQFSALRVTPAMAAGVTSKLWSVQDIVAMMDKKDAKRAA
jgi:hypothetical protein